MLAYFFKGMGVSAGLIMAIGSQNAHVLKMGLRREYVLLTVLICIACEALLILSGVAGVGTAIRDNPTLLQLAKWGGALFLLYYGLRSWKAVLHPQALAAQRPAEKINRKQASLTVLAVTLLNPHVYLDTVILLGAIAVQQPGRGPYWFAGGAIANAILWFSALGFGAQLLAPVFANVRAWQYLDAFIGAVMLLMAWNLLALAA